MKKIAIILSLTVSAALSGCYYDNEEELYPDTPAACGTTPASFSQDVAPILNNNCMSCHSQAANMGNVDLEGHTKVKAYADNGRLYGALSHASGFSPMPKGGAKLNDCTLAIIKRWIDDGSPNN